MPSMMENIVMKKCKVKFKLARTIVTDARNNMPQENRNCLWSKALEEECLQIYYDQYGVKLGLTRPPSSNPMDASNHTQDTTSTFATNTNSATSSLLPKQVLEDDGGALKKSRTAGKVKLRLEPIKSPSQTDADGKLSSSLRQKSLSKKLSPEMTTTSPSLRKSRALAEQTSFVEAGGESESSEVSKSRRSIRSVSRNRATKDKSIDSDNLDLSNNSAHSSKSSSSKTKKVKKSTKKTTSILDIEPSKKSTPRKKSLTRRSLGIQTEQSSWSEASDPFSDMEPPSSPSLAAYIASPPKSSSPSKSSKRLSAGMKSFDAPNSRDTTPLKPKVDKSPRKTCRKKSLALPNGAESAIRKAVEDHKDTTTKENDADCANPSSPTRIFIRCKRSKLKSPDKSNRDDDNSSIGPEDLLKISPDRKPTGSMVSLNHSRLLDGNSSKTKMVPVLRQSSGGSPSQKHRRGSKSRSSFKKEGGSMLSAPRSNSGRRSSAPESLLFLVSPSRETSMDNFQRSGLTRQDSNDSFLSVESFGASDTSPFDSPVQNSLANALPSLPRLSPCGKDDAHIVFDTETVESSLAAPKKPTRQTSNKASRRFR